MLKFLLGAGLAAISALGIVGCTTVNDELGLDFVPDNQKTLRLETNIDNINCFLMQPDSIPSSRLGAVFIGVTKSSVFGETKAGALMQFMSGGFKDKENGFGYLPIADSLRLFLATSSFTGKRDVDPKGQTFYIYNTKTEKQVNIDTTYYTDFKVAEYVDTSVDPLFTFQFTDTTSRYVDMKPFGDAGKDFMQSLIKQDKSLYESDTAFHKKFAGLYIASVPNTTDKQIFSIGLEDSHMVLYGHNHKKDLVVDGVPDPDGKDVKDTLSMAFYFDDNAKYSSNVSVNSIEHNYNETPIEAGIADKENPVKVTTAYIESLGGVATRLEFTKEFVEKLKAIKTHETTKYKSLVINKAEIKFYMGDDAQIPLLNAAQKRLGMYYKYNKVEPIPDYYYKYETDQGGTLAYGGYLNRGRGFYSMDITSYITQMTLNPELQKSITLAPGISQSYAFGQVALSAPDQAESPQRIKVQLTYTLIK